MNRILSWLSVASVALSGVVVAIASPALSAVPRHASDDLQAAGDQLIAENLVGGGALQDIPWQLAMLDIRNAIATDGSLKTEYQPVVNALTKLGSLPDTGVVGTIAQSYDANLAVVSQAFPDSSHDVSPGHERCYLNAARAWNRAPTNRLGRPSTTSMNLTVADLNQCITGRAEGNRDVPALIADIRGLEYSPTAAGSPLEMQFLIYFFSSLQL